MSPDTLAQRSPRPARRAFRLSSCLVLCLALCSTLAGSGCVYSDVSLPLDTNLEDTRLGDKTGRSESHAVLGLVAWGDASTRAAAEEGGIETIRHADMEAFSVLWIVYSRYTTVVYGD